MAAVQTLPTLPPSSTNICMYYINSVQENSALSSCCAPNPVQIAIQNAHWCQVPDRYFINTTTGISSSTLQDWVEGNFTQCLNSSNPNHTVESHYCNFPEYDPAAANAVGLALSSPLLWSLLIVACWFVSK